MSKLTADEQATISAYDAEAENWRNGHDNPEFWAKEQERLRKFVPGGRLLDVGSGAGRDAVSFIAGGYNYTGTDVSKGLLKIARGRNPQGHFLEQSVYDLNFGDKFDAFWCMSVLLHVPKVRIGEALAGIHRSLKPGAVGLITLKEGEGERVERGGDSQMQMGRFFAFWQFDDFTKVLERHGFEVFDSAARVVSPDRPRLLCFWVRAK